MKNSVTIRKAVSGDIDTICVLWQEMMDYHKNLNINFARSDDGHERFKDFITGHIAADTSCVLVGEHKGQIVGYCFSTLAKYPPIYKDFDYGAVFDLAVTERFRKKGIGEKLYRATEAWFADRGISRIELRVAVFNESSTEFWRKMGFSPYMATVYKNI